MTQTDSKPPKVVVANLDAHPLCALLPPLSAEDYEALREDIKAHGQRVPGIVWDSKVLDGWHRYRACIDLGLPFASQVFAGTLSEAIAMVKTLNIRRRHLSPTQRAFLAVELAKMEGGSFAPFGAKLPDTTEIMRNPQIPNAEGRPSAHLQEAAAAVQVSHRHAQRAKAVVTHGTAELVAATKSEQVSLVDAAEAAKAPPAQQKKAVAAVVQGEEKTLRAAIQKATKALPPSEDSEPLFDDNGIPIEGPGFFAFSDKPALLKLAAEISSSLPFLREVMGSVERGQHMPAGVDRALGKIVAQLKAAAYGCQCPYCWVNPEAEKCKTCFGQGWVPVSVQKALPDSLIQKAKRAWKHTQRG